MWLLSAIEEYEFSTSTTWAPGELEHPHDNSSQPEDAGSRSDGGNKADVHEITIRQRNKTRRPQVKPTTIGCDDDSLSDDGNEKNEDDNVYLVFGTIVEGDAEEVEQEEECMMEVQSVTADASMWDYWAVGEDHNPGSFTDIYNGKHSLRDSIASTFSPPFWWCC